MKELINNLYNYRQLLKSNVQKDIRGKYKGSFLGILWSFVNPLLMTLVYAIVFPIIMKSTEPHYTTFLVIAILPWNYFTTVINQGTTSILMNAGIIKKVYFPREILPISVNTSGLINYFIGKYIVVVNKESININEDNVLVFQEDMNKVFREVMEKGIIKL